MLVRAQVVVCLHFENHRTESIYSRFYPELKWLYDSLSGGAGLHGSEYFKRWQLAVAAEAWVRGAAPDFQMAKKDAISGKGFCFIDPHGDAIEDILTAIPKERAGDVVRQAGVRPQLEAGGLFDGIVVSGEHHDGRLPPPDDYVTKPFSLEELVARLRGLIRRSALAVSDSADSVLEVGDLRLAEDSYEVSRAGAAIELTATEFGLLRFLMRNPRRVLSKAQILDRVWSYDFGGRSSVVEIYISYLRKKIDTLGEPMIHTVRGFGYVLKPAG